MPQAVASPLAVARDAAEPQPPELALRRAQELSWIRAARSGDRAAFTRLYERFAPVVHGVLLAHTARADADDLAQEVFLTVWRRLGELRDAEAFPAWLLSIARNAASSRRRSAARPEPLRDGLPAPATGAADTDECERALAAIRSLPETYRETLMLRLVEGLSGPEIAQRTGLTHGSVRVNLCRGMALLRARLGIGQSEDQP